MPSIPYFSTGGFGLYFKIIRDVVSAVMPPSGAAVSYSEEGGSQVMRNTESFFMLCFVFSQLAAGQGNTSIAMTWIKCDFSMGHQMLYKVSFKNKFSFCCFYIHCKWPCQESEVQVSP